MSTSTFHVSLNVHDVRQAADFLERLLGHPPARRHADYAKFELRDPPLVLALAPTDAPAGGGLNHLGFRLANHAELAALKARLTAAEIPFDCEENVACCHSRQSKLWVHDPAGNLWELYALEEPAAREDATTCEPVTPLPIAQTRKSSLPPTAASRRATGGVTTTVNDTPAAGIWSHRLGEPLALPIAPPESLAEIVLEGTLNADPAQVDWRAVVAAAAAALRPGGRFLFHGLTADRALAGRPRLPGSAAAVAWVPTSDDVLTALAASGLQELELVTFGETYRFEHAGAEIRETRIRAVRGSGPAASNTAQVIYRGPFREIQDDRGQTFARGIATPVDRTTYDRLKEIAPTQFVFL